MSVEVEVQRVASGTYLISGTYLESGTYLIGRWICPVLLAEHGLVDSGSLEVVGCGWMWLEVVGGYRLEVGGWQERASAHRDSTTQSVTTLLSTPVPPRRHPSA